MQKVGIYKDGDKLKVAALSDEALIERLDHPAQFSEEDWEGVFVTGIEGDKVLVRHIESPLKKKRALEKTLPFQLENLIPFELDEVVVRPIYQIGKEKTRATFFVTSKETLEKHVIQQEGIDPAWVSCIPMALCRFAEFTKQDKEALIVFYVGKKTTEIVSIFQGTLKHNITLRIGLDDLEAAYKQDRMGEKESERVHSMRLLNLQTLSQEQYPHLIRALEGFKREVDRAFCFLHHKQELSELQFLLFAGETNETLQLEDWMIQWETFSYSVLPTQGHRGYDPNMVKTYAVPIGLAFDAIKQDRKSIQFRQGQWIAPEVYTSIKSKIFKGVSLCLAAAAALYIVGHVIYTKKEKAFLEDIHQFVQTYQKDIPKLEKIARIPSTQEKIHFLNRNIKVMKSDFGYFTPPTLVSDVLAFLSEHSHLNRQEGEKKMVIDQLKYELLDYPSVQKPFQSYQVKITVVFSSPESVWAREFHDAIVEDENWVDPDGEVTWKREKNVYTLSFILK